MIKNILFIGFIFIFFLNGCASIKQWAGGRWRSGEDEQKQEEPVKDAGINNTGQSK
ncbi:MAG: hypothetical protein AB1755_02720 [Candidatus Omnitrophota bacterium]